MRFTCLIVLLACEAEEVPLEEAPPYIKPDASDEEDDGDEGEAGYKSAQNPDPGDACRDYRTVHCQRLHECFPDSFPTVEGCLSGQESCEESFAADDCSNPSPEAFWLCEERFAAESCDELCGGRFCFAFCFYLCLD